MHPNAERLAAHIELRRPKIGWVARVFFKPLINYINHLEILAIDGKQQAEEERERLMRRYEKHTKESTRDQREN